MCSKLVQQLHMTKHWEKREYKHSVFFEKRETFLRYCKSTSFKLMYCLSIYNLANLQLPVVFSLKSPSLHPYSSLPHMESQILGTHSAKALACYSVRMRKVGLFFTAPNSTKGWQSRVGQNPTETYLVVSSSMKKGFIVEPYWDRMPD